jgi:hypothetical protein
MCRMSRVRPKEVPDEPASADRGGTYVRGKLVGCAVALALAVGGCTSHDPQPAPAAATGTSSPALTGSAPAWTEPAKYGFVLDRTCGSGPSEGRYQVAVDGGKVVTADRIDARTAEGEEEIDVPTLGELLDMAQTATDDGAAVTTTLDRVDGHPTAVSIDVSDGATGDGAACFVISGYRPAA